MGCKSSTEKKDEETLSDMERNFERRESKGPFEEEEYEEDSEATVSSDKPDERGSMAPSAAAVAAVERKIVRRPVPTIDSLVDGVYCIH